MLKEFGRLRWFFTLPFSLLSSWHFLHYISKNASTSKGSTRSKQALSHFDTKLSIKSRGRSILRPGDVTWDELAWMRLKFLLRTNAMRSYRSRISRYFPLRFCRFFNFAVFDRKFGLSRSRDLQKFYNLAATIQLWVKMRYKLCDSPWTPIV